MEEGSCYTACRSHTSGESTRSAAAVGGATTKWRAVVRYLCLITVSSCFGFYVYCNTILSCFSAGARRNEYRDIEYTLYLHHNTVRHNRYIIIGNRSKKPGFSFVAGVIACCCWLSVGGCSEVGSTRAGETAAAATTQIPTMGSSNSTGRSDGGRGDGNDESGANGGEVVAPEPATMAPPADKAEPQLRPDDEVDDVELQSLARPPATRKNSTASDARALLHHVLIFGRHAVAYGSIGSRVEQYLVGLLLNEPSQSNVRATTDPQPEIKYHGCRCIRAHISVMNAEILASATFIVPKTASSYSDGETGDASSSTEEQTFTEMVQADSGTMMRKLGALAELAKEVKAGKIALEEAVYERLPEIEAMSPPYSNLTVLVCGYVGAGFGLAVLLGGGWWDVLLASVGASFCWAVGALLDGSGRYVPAYFSIWAPFLSAFFPAVLASAVFVSTRPEVNFILASVSSVAIPIPGYTISLGVAEIVMNRIVRGFGHLVQGVVVLVWLSLGIWLGSALVMAIAGIDYELDTSTDVPLAQTWYILAVPLLAVALSIAFYVPARDFPWTFLICCISYLVTYAASYIKNDRAYLDTFLSATVTTMCANCWSWYFDRPQTIAMLPGIVFLVAGSGGLLGLLTFDASGIGRMFIVALVIVVGVFAGNTVFRLPTTL